VACEALKAGVAGTAEEEVRRAVRMLTSLTGKVQNLATFTKNIVTG
jgi:hypothetical protein